MTEKDTKKVAKKTDGEKASAKKAAKAHEAKAESKKEAAATAADEAPKAAKKPAKEAKTSEKKEKKEKSGKLKSSQVSDPSLYDIIVRPIITEKSTAALESSTYLFVVNKTATKPRIKLAVEQIFGVEVRRVNTLTLKGKTKRFRGLNGRRSDVKKAMVTLKQGQTIDFAAGVR